MGRNRKEQVTVSRMIINTQQLITFWENIQQVAVISVM